MIANSFDSSGIFAPTGDDPVGVRFRVEGRIVVPCAEGEDEGDVRAVDDEARPPAAPSRAAGNDAASTGPAGASSTEKTVPMVTLASMLEEPSSGSIATRSVPSASTASGSSRSSDTSRAPRRR